MNSRYGLWIVSVCWISLAGCANWQSRMGANSPGGAATMAPAPAATSGPLLGAPGSSLNEPPPPLAPLPSDPNSSLSPLGPPVGQKLDLSSVSSEPVTKSSADSSKPGRMYNLDSSDEGSSKKTASAPRKSSTLSKLASKAGTKNSAEEVAEAPKKRISVVEKLSVEADKSSSEKAAAEKPAAEKAEVEGIATTPPPTPGKVAAEAEAPAAALDTTLLAQPVRKGSSEEKSSAKESKGPQSRLVPGGKFFDNKSKPAIYPVSNPVSEEPIDLIKFS